MKWFAALVMMLSFSLVSCEKEETDEVILTGVLEKNDGITTYQYGEFFIGTFALRSDKIDLLDYVNEKVQIKGDKIEGYPIENGPEYLEVIEIERK
ncbi:hypothetical protein [Crocinitomix algicola]|uniref:hypothetical protein n=1 Tax=Crocinitomix algicola TaxID=1740263 RepID=UPI001112EC31|nr:hypothetical protein [Crocinitomix algicola]